MENKIKNCNMEFNNPVFKCIRDYDIYFNLTFNKYYIYQCILYLLRVSIYNIIYI